ncbi:MAG: hypothetical protein AAGF66_06490 [Cyanobacteria bacterium P01_H01_bin.119]
MLLEVSQTEKVFQDVLSEAGILLLSQDKWGSWNTSNPSARTVWYVFKSFAGLKVNIGDNENDALLFQWGKRRELETHIEYFYLDFTRQFSLYRPDGQYDCMEQLKCTLRYAMCSELDIPLGNLWSYQLGNFFESFFIAVEETEQFQLGMNKYQPLRLDMCQGQV